MKKQILFLIVFAMAVVSGVYAWGIYEYKGQKYIGGEFAGYVAQEYALRKDTSEYGIDSAVSGNRLYFISVVFPRNFQDILKRGYIQNGDTFELTTDYPNHATYQGQRIAKNVISLDDGSCYGIGYAQHGGAITIVEIMSSAEMSLRGAERGPKVLRGIKPDFRIT